MASPRRTGGPDAKHRDLLLDTAERIMLSDGYAAVSSRRVAVEAGLKSQLVHYYFGSMDGLFLGLIRRFAGTGLERVSEILASPRPLRGLWAFSMDPKYIALSREFVALANHRKVVEKEITRYAEEYRHMQLQVLTDALNRCGITPEECPPAAIALMMTHITRGLVMERQLGVSVGHAEMIAMVERFLDRVEGEETSRSAAVAGEQR